MADDKKKKQKPYLSRALNTFGAKITGRSDLVKKDTAGQKYLTAKELEAYDPEKSKKKK